MIVGICRNKVHLRGEAKCRVQKVACQGDVVERQQTENHPGYKCLSCGKEYNKTDEFKAIKPKQGPDGISPESTLRDVHSAYQLKQASRIR